MKVENIKDVRIADNGNHAEVTFVGLGNIKLQFSFELLQDLVRGFAEVLVAARFNRGQHSDTPTQFSDKRDIILVDKLELHLAPDGSIDFLIESKGKSPLQVSLHAQHGRLLRDILAGKGNDVRLN